MLQAGLGLDFSIHFVNDSSGDAGRPQGFTSNPTGVSTACQAVKDDNMKVSTWGWGWALQKGNLTE